MCKGLPSTGAEVINSLKKKKNREVLINKVMSEWILNR